MIGAYLADSSEEPSCVNVLLGRSESDERVSDDVRSAESDDGRSFASEEAEEDAGNESPDQESDAGQARDPRRLRVRQRDVSEIGYRSSSKSQ